MGLRSPAPGCGRATCSSSARTATPTTCRSISAATASWRRPTPRTACGSRRCAGRATSARAATSTASVAAREERRERAGDGGDDEDRPELEEDVDDLPAARQGILERRGDRQDLDRREEECV